MGNVGDSAYTDHGQGEIKEIDTVRGRRSFRVAGRGFDVWVPETKLRVAKNPWGAPYNLETTIDQGDINERNHTTLPYDPTPQFPVDMFRREQTILPGDHEIDAEQRLRPTDSRSNNRADANRPYPGPATDLFAKGAAAHYSMEEESGELGGESEGDECLLPHHAYRTAELDCADEGDSFKEWGDDDWTPETNRDIERTFGRDAGAHHLPGEDDYPGYEQPRYSGGEHEAWEPQNGQGPGHGGYFPGKQISVPSASEREGSYRPAGLSARYAHIIDAADERNPIVAFHQDPLDFMQRRAYVMTAGDEARLEAKFAREDHLLEADQNLRTAAWTDVRQKAQRLRREGRVHVNHVTPQHIYATVDGDHASYDTMIVKGAAGAFTGGQQIAQWYCDCDWGKWAFQRKFSYVGRLCSHAYAAYLDMQSHYHKNNPGKFKAASRRTAGVVEDFKKWADENNDGHMDPGSISDFVNTCHDDLDRDDVASLYEYLEGHHQVAPERNFDVPYTLDNEKAYKTSAEADVQLLRQRPHSLSPDMRDVPKNDEHEWADVTKDERETTGPDEIIHFSAIAASLHHADWGVPTTTTTTKPAAPAAPSGGSGGSSNDNSVGGPNSGFGQTLKGLGIENGIPGGIGGPTFGAPGLAGGAFGPDSAFGKTFGGGDDSSKPPANTVSDVKPAGTPGAPSQLPGDQLGKANPDGTHTPVPNSAFSDAFSQSRADGPAAPGAGGPSFFNKNGPKTPAQVGTQPDGSWQHSRDSAPIGLNPGAGPGNGGGSYTVKPGDTLADIAQRSGLGGNYQDLAKQNGISDPNSIGVGQQIKLPGGPGGASTPPAAQPSAGQAPTAQQPAAKPAAPAATPPAQPPAATKPKGPLGAGTGPLGGGLFGGGNNPASPLHNLLHPQSPGTTPVAPPPANPAPGATPPGGNVTTDQVPPLTATGSLAARLHYAENDDDDQRPDTGQAARDLDRLRELGAEDPSSHYQHMDDYNQDVRNLVEDLNEAGVDAMPFVAALHAAIDDGDSDPSDFAGGFPGRSYPNWADEPFNGSGPSPKLWSSDSASYVEQHERPDFTDLNDGEGDIVKFNDSRSKPQQGPHHGSRRRADGVANGNTLGDLAGGAGFDLSQMSGVDPGSFTDGMSANGGSEQVMASRHYADDQSGYFNPNNPSAEDWEQGSGAPFMNEVGHQADQLGGGGQFPGGEEGAEGAEGGELAEAAPLLMAASRQGGFSLEAFDQGAFSFEEAAGPGELRRAGRIGGGPTQPPRIDPGARGNAKQRRQGSPPPEDFGYDGDSELGGYGESGSAASDIVASFQRSAGALEMMHASEGSARSGSLDDFASSPMVQGMLRTAGRKFTPQEERDLEQEEHHLGARNLPTSQDLEGTHYLMNL
jgi:hypothetical protein